MHVTKRGSHQLESGHSHSAKSMHDYVHHSVYSPARLAEEQRAIEVKLKKSRHVIPCPRKYVNKWTDAMGITKRKPMALNSAFETYSIQTSSGTDFAIKNAA